MTGPNYSIWQVPHWDSYISAGKLLRTVPLVRSGHMVHAMVTSRWVYAMGDIMMVYAMGGAALPLFCRVSRDTSALDHFPQFSKTIRKFQILRNRDNAWNRS